MQTPDNKSGWLTEEIMSLILMVFPKPPMDTPTYNRTYEAVYDALRVIEELSQQDSPGAK